MLYGIDVFIVPEFRGLRLGRRLYDARKELCENLNLVITSYSIHYTKLYEKLTTSKQIYFKPLAGLNKMRFMN